MCVCVFYCSECNVIRQVWEQMLRMSYFCTLLCGFLLEFQSHFIDNIAMSLRVIAYRRNITNTLSVHKINVAFIKVFCNHEQVLLSFLIYFWFQSPTPLLYIPCLKLFAPIIVDLYGILLGIIDNAPMVRKHYNVRQVDIWIY